MLCAKQGSPIECIYPFIVWEQTIDDSGVASNRFFALEPVDTDTSCRTSKLDERLILDLHREPVHRVPGISDFLREATDVSSSVRTTISGRYRSSPAEIFSSMNL